MIISRSQEEFLLSSFIILPIELLELQVLVMITPLRQHHHLPSFHPFPIVFRAVSSSTEQLTAGRHATIANCPRDILSAPTELLRHYGSYVGVYDRNSPFANFIYELDRPTPRERAIEKPVPLGAALPQASLRVPGSSRDTKGEN